MITEINITEIASTKLRERLQNRQGREYFSDALYTFIIKNRCYGAKPDYEWLREKSYAMHKTKRIPHVRGCEEEAVRLAERWGADIDDARTSGILHDITKKCNLDEQLILCRKYGILTDTLESVSEKLLHSKTGAAVARSEFGVNDKVFNAIYWHTTGKENMTLLEKVLYLADYIEPNRDFDGVEPLRKLCYEDIDAAMKLGLEMSIEDLEQRGSPIHRHTLDAFKFYKMRKDEE